MKKIVFIIPYFGKFNNYFQLFLNSCQYNADLCDWIIFTDDRSKFEYPNNVFVHYTEWEEIKKYISSKFEFAIALEKPYKLCDFRGAYGYIFREYIGNYEFWGYCDVDLIFGKMSDFLTNEILESYQKIFDLGHCTIYRNSITNNQIFKSELNGKYRYIEVFSNKNNCSFDEEYNQSINSIFEAKGIPIYNKSFAANTYTKTSNFKLTYMNDCHNDYKVERNIRNFFVWNHGRIIRYIKCKKKWEKKEYMYIHFQARPMKVRLKDKMCNIYKIIPNSFDELEIEEKYLELNEELDNIKFKHINLHYFILRIGNLYKKIRKKIEHEY